jgi:hypothetical protein
MAAIDTLTQKLRSKFPLFDIFLKFGLTVVICEIRNRFLLWDATELIRYSTVKNTSISSGMGYSGLCDLAVKDSNVFSKFKCSRQYRDVLEHLDYEQGLKYLHFIENNSFILENLRLVNEFDIGKPFRYYFKGIGYLSPTHIRYAKVLQDLENLFGELDNKVISEIGIGYGGQAAHILTRWKLREYRFFDLEQVNQLALKYISVSNMPVKIKPVPSDMHIKSECDLVISNYAFSELIRDVQDSYIENIINHASAGYLIYNHIHEELDASYSAQEFASKIPGAEILKESPLTYPGNVLVVWGHRKISQEE